MVRKTVNASEVLKCIFFIREHNPYVIFVQGNIFALLPCACTCDDSLKRSLQIIKYYFIFYKTILFLLRFQIIRHADYLV